MKEVQREKFSKVYLVALIQKRAQMEPPHHWLNTKDMPVILGVDRLGKQKNFPLLIHTLALVVQKCPARLIILGEGPYLKRLARNLIFVEYVDMLGLSAKCLTLISHGPMSWPFLPQTYGIRIGSNLKLNETIYDILAKVYLLKRRHKKLLIR